MKKRGIKRKMTVAIIAMGILLSLCVSIGVFTINFRHVSAQYTERVFSSAIAAAVLVNGDSIEGYLENGKDEEYFTIYEALKEIKSVFNLTYLYVLTQSSVDNIAVYVFDIIGEGADPSLFSDLGDELSDAEATTFDAGAQTFRTGQIEDSTIVSLTGYGWLASAYVPIFASDGRVTAVMGADLSMNRIMGDILLQTLQILLITVAIIIVFLFIFRYIAGKQILHPVLHLSQHMDGFDPEKANLKKSRSQNPAMNFKL